MKHLSAGMARTLFAQYVEPDGTLYGWIARNGEWYPCEFGAHDGFAWIYWGEDEDVTEQTCVKVTDWGWGGPERITSFQRRTLERLGFLDAAAGSKVRDGYVEHVPMARDLKEALEEWKDQNGSG